MAVDPTILGRISELEAENRRLRDALRDANARFQTISRAIQGAAYEVEPSGYVATARDQELTRVRRLNALKARCFVAKLSDAQRRAALDKAYEAGAIDDDLDESELPWRSDEFCLDPAVDPVRATTVSEAAGVLGDLGPTKYAFWLMARLARISPQWKQMRPGVYRGWDALVERDADAAEPFYWPERAFALAAEPGRANYPTGLTAVFDEQYSFPSGLLRNFGVWYAPFGMPLGGEKLWDESEELEKSRLMAEARALSPRDVRLAMTRLGRAERTVRALALVEVVLGGVGRVKKRKARPRAR